MGCNPDFSFALFTGFIDNKHTVIVFTVAVAVEIIEIIGISLCGKTAEIGSGNDCNFHFIFFRYCVASCDKCGFNVIGNDVCLVNNERKCSFNLFKLGYIRIGSICDRITAYGCGIISRSFKCCFGSRIKSHNTAVVAFVCVISSLHCIDNCFAENSFFIACNIVVVDFLCFVMNKNNCIL